MEGNNKYSTDSTMAQDAIKQDDEHCCPHAVEQSKGVDCPYHFEKKRLDEALPCGMDCYRIRTKVTPEDYSSWKACEVCPQGSRDPYRGDVSPGPCCNAHTVEQCTILFNGGCVEGKPQLNYTFDSYSGRYIL